MNMETETVTISLDRFEALHEAAVDLLNIQNAINSFEYDQDKVKAIKSILGMRVDEKADEIND